MCFVQPTEHTRPHVSHKSMCISICWTNTDKCAASGTVRFQAELCEKWLLEDTRLVQNYQTETPTGPHRERRAGKISTRKCRNELIQKKEEQPVSEARMDPEGQEQTHKVCRLCCLWYVSMHKATLVKAWVQIRASKFSCGHKVQSHPSAHRCSSGCIGKGTDLMSPTMRVGVRLSTDEVLLWKRCDSPPMEGKPN